MRGTWSDVMVQPRNRDWSLSHAWGGLFWRFIPIAVLVSILFGVQNGSAWASFHLWMDLVILFAFVTPIPLLIISKELGYWY